MDLISVIVITYNSEATIIETLESIEKQTYPELELIIADDASKDNTVQIVKKWVQRNAGCFKQIRILVAKRNHGITKNCNIAIHQARGKYIQFIAGDDLLVNTAIEKKYQFIRNRKLKMVYSKIEPFGLDKRVINDVKELCERSYEVIAKGWKYQNDTIVIENFLLAPAGSFFDKKIFFELGYYDTRFPMLEDYPFYYRYITHGNEIILLDEVLMKYRVSENSLSGSGNAKFKHSVKKFFYFVRLKELLKRKKYNVIKEQIKFFRGW